MTMSQIAAETVNVVALTPRSAHGDTEAKPSPDPRANNIKETAMATKAPAKIAPHDAADFGEGLRSTPTSAVRGSKVRSMVFTPLMVRTHGEQQNDRQRHTQHPEKYSASHDFSLVIKNENVIARALC